MSPAVHAKLSASSSHRWLYCPPSVVLEEQFPDTGSAYAEEGTFAHSLAELYLSQALDPRPKPEWEEVLAGYKTDPHYSTEMHEFISDYCTTVMDRIYETRFKCPDAEIMLEERLDFSPWVPDGFGTGDVVIVADGEMQVIDLKYGAGVPVSAENNSQLRLYGLGAINNYGFLYDIKLITMTIIQPRLGSISSESLTAQELKEWGETFVVPRAKLAMTGEGEYGPSEKTCQWCKAKAVCTARANKHLELAKADFVESMPAPQLLTEDQIAAVLAQGTQLIDWINDVKAHALSQAVNHGASYPGFKVVAGRANRKYSDERAVVQALKDKGFEEAILYERKLLSITEMEKAVGKKVLADLPEGLIIKPPGKPALVPLSDKRPEANLTLAAQAEFSEEI